MGSTVSIALTLVMTGAVFLLLHQDSRLAEDSRPLLTSCLVFVILAAVAAASFVAELKTLRWRYLAHAGLVALLALVGWHYWPEG